MQPGGTLLDPRARGVDRRSVFLLGSGLSLDKANGLAIGNVDSGKQGEGHDVTLGASSGSDGADPGAQHSGPGVAGLLRVELSR